MYMFTMQDICDAPELCLTLILHKANAELRSLKDELPSNSSPALKQANPADTYKLSHSLGTVHQGSKTFVARRKQDGKELMIKWAKKADEGQVLAARASELSQLASDSLL